MGIGDKTKIKKSSRAIKSKDIKGYEYVKILLYGTTGAGKSGYSVESERHAGKIAVFDFEDGYGGWASKYNFVKYTYDTSNFNIGYFKQDWREAVNDGCTLFVVDSFTRIHKHLKYNKKNNNDTIKNLSFKDKADINENADFMLEEMLNVKADLILIAWSKDEFISDGGIKFTVHKGGIMPDIGTSQSVFMTHLILNFNGSYVHGTQEILVEKTRSPDIQDNVSNMKLDDILKILHGE